MKISFKPINRISYIIPFGKYQGKTVDQLIDEDPDYLLWAHYSKNMFLSSRIRRWAESRSQEQECSPE